MIDAPRQTQRLPRGVALALAFATVYLVWGSTYLAIRIGVEHLPPALFAGSRFLVAGLILVLVALLRGGRLPGSRRDWSLIALTGVLMLVGGNGLVTWAEQWVPSNQAALIVATSALWMAGFGALGAAGDRLGPVTLGGLLLGFLGVGLLVHDGLGDALGRPGGYLAVLLAALFWAAGSVLSRRYPVACPTLIYAGLQSLIAGAVLVLIGLARGELDRWTWQADGLLALGYLVVFGSCIAYAAYFWLVRQVTPAQLGTYAYVNPAVAVLLGWLILDERLTAMQVIGTVVILAGVLLVSVEAQGRRRAARVAR